jgi:alkylation response protein AidB-like acyl-CoA dehydrogenase
MDFDFSEEQYMFRDTVKSFLEEKYGLAKVRALEKDGRFDAELWAALNEMGTFAMLVPEQFGGLGLSFIDVSLVLEEYGRALVPAPVAETIVATDLIAKHGSDEQKARLLPLIAAGNLKIVPAIVETDAGYDPEDISVTAVTSGNGWRLSGRKLLVPHAAAADLILAAIRFGAGGPLGLALLEPSREGISLRLHATLDLSNRFYEVAFDNVSLLQDDILGGGASPVAVRRLIDVSGVAAAAQMTGIASKVLDEAVKYAGQRVQFDKPIGSFQAIKHRCADMAVSIDASRSAAYYAAWAVAEHSSDSGRAVSIAKSFCGDTSRFVCNEGIQLHGGIGFTWELGLHLYLRRAKVLEYSYGDAAYHRERVLAGTLTEMQSGTA